MSHKISQKYCYFQGFLIQMSFPTLYYASLSATHIFFKWPFPRPLVQCGGGGVLALFIP
jgi:hypothetical protein